MRVRDKLIENRIGKIYEKVADEFGVSPLYVGKIARGERKGLRGKGNKVRLMLEQLADEIVAEL